MRSAMRVMVMVLAVAIATPGCEPGPTGLAQLRARGELRVATLNQPTTYYLGSQGPQGFEYRLARAFADSLGIQLIIGQADDRVRLRELLAEGRADIAAAQLTADENWKRVGLATATYQEIQELVVQRRGRPPSHNIAALNGARVVVRSDSPQLQLLHDLRASGATYLAWTELPREQADPLDWLSSGDADYAIVDKNEFEFARHLYPDVAIAFTLPDPRPVQWLVRRPDLELRDAVNRFFVSARDSGLLRRLVSDAEAEAGGFEYLEARRFPDDIRTRLPEMPPRVVQAPTPKNPELRLLPAVGDPGSHLRDQGTT